MKILFVGVPRHVPRLLASGRVRAALGDAPRPLRELPNITITQPPRVAPESTEWGLRLNQRLYRRHIRAVAKRLGLTEPVLWVNPHWAYHVRTDIRHAGVVYDITDDWTTLTQKELDRRRTVAADRQLCQTADATIVCSQRLRQLKEPLVPAGRLYLIPNGVDADHYARVLQPGPVPTDIAALPRPVYGYTGTIHPDRLDVELLLHIAPELTGSMALVGPSFLSPGDAARLAATGKIHLFPAVPYARIPDVMRGFDVAITPHRMTAFTESLNPIKLWEYLAAGKPIVATDVAGFRDYPEHVRLARTPAEFAAALRDAAAEAASPEAAARAAARHAVARQHSWDRRVDAIEQIIHTALIQATARRGHATTAQADDMTM